MEKYQSDVWDIEDALGFGGAGDVVAGMVLEVEPPFTLGVVGKWGSGKTSVMRTAFATLGGEVLKRSAKLAKDLPECDEALWKRYAYNAEPPRPRPLAWAEDGAIKAAAESSLCVWFSPWQHQNEANPLLPLLTEVREQFGAWLKLKSGAKAFNRRGGLAALSLLEGVIDAAATLALGKNIHVARGAGETVRKAWRGAAPIVDEPGDGQRFHLMFQEAVENLLTSVAEKSDTDELGGGARLVIFVDDLDRCEESVVVSLLESIKLYLGSRRCVFVLGLDDGAVLGALANQWPGRSREDNREYLDKLFQATIGVPQPRPEQVVHGVQAQLLAHRIEAEAAAEAAKDVQRLLEPNPRKIKNFTNGLCAAWALGQGRGRGGETVTFALRRLVLFHYLRNFHRPVWRVLEREPETLKLLHHLLTNGSESEPPRLESLEMDDQRLALEMFSRAFTHVLRGLAEEKPEKTHRRMELEKAVELFVERVDRKRSDEVLKQLFDKLVSPEESLDENYLMLPEVKPNP